MMQKHLVPVEKPPGRWPLPKSQTRLISFLLSGISFMLKVAKKEVNIFHFYHRRLILPHFGLSFQFQRFWSHMSAHLHAFFESIDFLLLTPTVVCLVIVNFWSVIEIPFQTRSFGSVIALDIYNSISGFKSSWTLKSLKM